MGARPKDDKMSTPSPISVEALHQRVKSIFLSCGLTPQNAEAVTDVIVAGERDQCKSHGIYRIEGCLRVTLIMANLFVVFFGLSWGPIVWVLLGEMFNNRIRGAALAVAASAQWIANFAITMTFPIMLGSIGLAGAYGFYTLSAFISVFFVVKYIKETRGMKLESM